MEIKKIRIQPTHAAAGRWQLNMSQVPLPEHFVVKKQCIVSIEKGLFAGNHKHARSEVLLGLHPDLVFIWEDENGKRHKEAMHPNGELILFVVPPLLPHVVINNSKESSAILYEWTDSEDVTVEKVNLIDHL
jgi:uncharacterized RmlC-like cupin family protein